jgi:hypothetical protein
MQIDPMLQAEDESMLDVPKSAEISPFIHSTVLNNEQDQVDPGSLMLTKKFDSHESSPFIDDGKYSFLGEYVFVY